MVTSVKAKAQRIKKAGKAGSSGGKRGRKGVENSGAAKVIGTTDPASAVPTEGGTRRTVKEEDRGYRVAKVLDKVIQRFGALLKNKQVKPTVGDYVRLLQLRRELGGGDEGTKEIKITWVDQKEESWSGE